MRVRDEKGSARSRPLLVMLGLLLCYGAALAVDSYMDPPFPGVPGAPPGVRVSTNTGAVSFPLIQLRTYTDDPATTYGGELWNNTTRKTLRSDPSGGGLAMGLCFTATTAVTPSVELINPTSNTTLALSVTLPAGSLSAGKKLRIKAAGRYTSGFAGNANLKWTTSLTGVALANTSNVSTTTTANRAWDVESEIQIYTAGASGTLFNKIRGTCENAALVDAVKIGRATGAIDTTVENTLSLLVTFSASDSTNRVTEDDFSVEMLN